MEDSDNLNAVFFYFVKNKVKLYFSCTISASNIIHGLACFRVFTNEIYFVKYQVVISVCLVNRPFICGIKPDFFQVRNSFFTNDKWQDIHLSLARSFFRLVFASKFLTNPLFSPCWRAFTSSFFLDSSNSRSLSAVRTTSLAE